MTLKTEWLRYGNDQEFTGYAAWIDAAKPPLPAVLVVQEAWGVDAHLEDVTERFAKAGYFAVAPDLFSKGGKRPEALSRARLDTLKAFVDKAGTAVVSDLKAREEALAKLSEAQRSPLQESFTDLFTGALRQTEVHMAMMQAAAQHVRQHPLTKGGKLAALGFCLGGGVAARFACIDPQLAAAVSFYGNPPPPEQIPAIACPVLAFNGSLDARLAGGLPAFAAAMEKHGKHLEHHMYEGAHHAFFNDTRPSYDSRAARDAFARSLDFLRRNV